MNKVAWILLGALGTAVVAHPRAADAAPTPRGPNTQLARVIDGLAKRGQISAQDAARLRRDALENGAGPRVHLPTSQDGHLLCLTQAMNAAKSWAQTQDVHLMSDPPVNVGYVESKTLPLRVYYQEESDKFMAESVLPLAETAWTKQVTETGYPAPFTGEDNLPVIPGLWIYIADSGMGGGGYTEWLKDVPSTPVSDCSSRVVIDRQNPYEYLEIVTAHEFNHTTQMATDCVEAISAWENFTSAVDSYFVDDWQLPYMIGIFQRYPEYPIDFWSYGDGSDELAYYQYGAALFPIFLRERFGGGDIKLLRDLWYSFAQAGTLTCSPMGCTSDQPNTPNWFEGTDAVLKKNHGSTWDDAFDEFTVWRAITGSHDDGKHFKGGTQYDDVMTAATHSLAQLPAKGDLELQEYGSRYVSLTPGSFQGKLHFKITADPEATWSSSVLLGRHAQPVERVQMTFDKATGELTVPVQGSMEWITLVIAQHSDGTHNPDDMEYYTSRSFSYLVEGIPDPEPGPEPLPEAGPDANKPGKDGGKVDSGPVAAEAAPSDDGGCGCEVPGKRADTRLGAFALLGLAALLRRRPVRRP
ncbi:MAG: hypothetical protein HY898_24315 [Deltaproteobacteria bacterium]|nr:hypothetical protein [Deltaproteobacteria bacterium]